MFGNYIIRAVIDAVSAKPVQTVRDRFNCGVNDDPIIIRPPTLH